MKTTAPLSLLFIVVAIAQTVASAREDVLEDTLPLVLTPARLPQRLDESSSTITVIDRTMIEASGARRLVDVLQLVPGFSVGTKHNHLPTVGYQGLDDEFARRMLVLVDGQRIFQHSRGVVEWNNFPIPLEDIARIEVVRGPDAATYGSNAFEAVINIQTLSPAESRGLYLRGAAGSDGIADGFLRVGSQIGAVDYSLSLASKGDHGYDAVHDSRRNNSLTWLSEIPVAAMGALMLRAGYAWSDYDVEEKQFPFGWQQRHFPVTENFQSLQWRQSVTGDDELVFNLARSHFRYDDKGTLSGEPVPGIALQVRFDIEEERYESDLYYTRDFSKRLRTVAGAGCYYERVKAPYFFNTQSTASNTVYRLFGHGEYRPHARWVVNAGTMLEYSQLSGNWLFLPRASLHVHLDDQQTLRLIYATGSRQPTLYENQGRAVMQGVNVPLTVYRVYATGVEQGGLNAEINRSLELGYFWHPSRHLGFDVRIYQEKLSDLIIAHYRVDPERLTVLPGNQLLDFGNEKTLTVRGLEAQLDWQTRFGTRLFAGYALTDIEAGNTRFDSGYAESAPQHTVSLLGSQQLPNGWEVSLNYHYQSGMTWYLDAPIDAYHQLDARLAKTFSLGNRRAVAEIVGTNLLGSVNDYLPTRAWDSGVFFRLALEY